MEKRRVGIVGYGSLGKYLAEKIEKSPNFELDFVWNRTIDKIAHFPASKRVKDLNEVVQRAVDIIIEVSHPSITILYAELFLGVADYFVGSPTVFADSDLFQRINRAAVDHNHVTYVPAGAFWGGDDIKKMADSGTLTAVTVTMRKHPSAFRLSSPLKEKLDAISDEPSLLYEGPVRNLCVLAPNNVNTMAAACIAGHNLGFDRIVGRLFADKSLRDWHIVEIDVKGNNGFDVNVIRKNPAQFGVVTGAATYDSFWSSLKNAYGKTPGTQLC